MPPSPLQNIPRTTNLRVKGVDLFSLLLETSHRSSLRKRSTGKSLVTKPLRGKTLLHALEIVSSQSSSKPSGRLGSSELTCLSQLPKMHGSKQGLDEAIRLASC